MPLGYHEYPGNASHYVPPSRHPFQLWMMVACVLSGVAQMAGVVSGSAFNAAAGDYALLTWGFMLFSGGLTAIVAAYLKERILGLLLERLALNALAASMMVFAVSQFALVGAAATMSALFTGFAGVSCFRRARQVSHDLKDLTEWIQGQD